MLVREVRITGCPCCHLPFSRQTSVAHCVLFFVFFCVQTTSLQIPFVYAIPSQTNKEMSPNLFYWNILKAIITSPFLFFFYLDCLSSHIFLSFTLLQLITLADYFPDSSAFSQLTPLCHDYFIYRKFSADDFSLQNILFYSWLCHLSFFPTYSFQFSSALHLSFIS